MHPAQVGLLGALSAIWGGSYLLIKYALEDFSPPMIVWPRVAIAARRAARADPAARAAARARAVGARAARPAGRALLLGALAIARRSC